MTSKAKHMRNRDRLRLAAAASGGMVQENSWRLDRMKFGESLGLLEEESQASGQRLAKSTLPVHIFNASIGVTSLRSSPFPSYRAAFGNFG